jgi:hypothetical protein
MGITKLNTRISAGWNVWIITRAYICDQLRSIETTPKVRVFWLLTSKLEGSGVLFARSKERMS